MLICNRTERRVLLGFQTSCGLRIQDLQEAKDLLLVETADMLQLPLFTAEALLRNYGTSDFFFFSSCCRVKSRFQNGPKNLSFNRGLMILFVVVKSPV